MGAGTPDIRLSALTSQAKSSTPELPCGTITQFCCIVIVPGAWDCSVIGGGIVLSFGRCLSANDIIAKDRRAASAYGNPVYGVRSMGRETVPDYSKVGR